MEGVAGGRAVEDGAQALLDGEQVGIGPGRVRHQAGLGLGGPGELGEQRLLGADPGSWMGPAGSEAPWTFSPWRTTGVVGPMPTARNGLDPFESSHRPIQPVVVDDEVEPLCQMSMDSKWL